MPNIIKKINKIDEEGNLRYSVKYAYQKDEDCKCIKINYVDGKIYEVSYPNASYIDN